MDDEFPMDVYYLWHSQSTQNLLDIQLEKDKITGKQRYNAITTTREIRDSELTDLGIQ